MQTLKSPLYFLNTKDLLNQPATLKHEIQIKLQDYNIITTTTTSIIIVAVAAATGAVLANSSSSGCGSSGAGSFSNNYCYRNSHFNIC